MVDHEMNRNDTPAGVNVTRDSTGWEVREEGDAGEIKVAHYSDWHRVERALRTIEFDRTSRSVTGDPPRS